MAASAASMRRAARAMPGVHAVITAAEIGESIPIIPLRLANLPEFKAYLQPVIAQEKVRYVGEPLAVVVAETPALAEDALEAIEVDIERLPAVPDRHAAASDESLLFEESGSNRALRYAVAFGDADAAFAKADYTRRESFRCHRLDRLAAGDPRPDRRMGRGEGQAHRLRRHQGAVLQSPRARAHARARRGRHRHDRARRRRRLRGARRILSRGFSDSVRRAPGRPAGEMDRGSPRAPDGDQSLARGRLRASRSPARATASSSACAATSMPTWAPISAPTAGVVPAKAAQFLPGPYRIRDVAITVEALMTSKTPVGTLRAPGAVRGQLLPRAAARHGGARSRPRSDGLPPQEPDHRGRAAVRHRQAGALRGRDRIRHRRLSRDLRARARPRSAGPRRSRCRAG